jgi:N-acyl-phosphatidylethanolamine-hydrolysing phospholipase D
MRAAAKASSKPAHHVNSEATGFRNPWVQPKSLLESGQVIWNKFPLEWARRLHDHPAEQVRVVKPDFGKDSPDEGRVKATWLGHAVRVAICTSLGRASLN